MKRVVTLLLVLGFSLLACTAFSEESGATDMPLSLYPAYLQTPLNMPVVLDAETVPAGQRLVWSSSIPSVATVDWEGCVTPVSPGETVITCALADFPGVTATCGVLVVAEGKILLWEYPPEPMDLDAIIAEMEAEYAANPPEVPWPAAWPDDLPRMEGVVKSAGGGLTEDNGLYVMLTVQELDTVKAYVDELLLLGFKGNPMEYDGGFFAQLTGNGYAEMMVSYTENEHQCYVNVKK